MKANTLGQASAQDAAELRDEFTRWQQAQGEVTDCGDPAALAEQICAWLPNTQGNEAEDVAASFVDIVFVAPHVMVNAGLNMAGVDPAIRIPSLMDATGFGANSAICQAAITHGPAVIEMMSEEDVKESTGLDKQQLQEFLCQGYSVLSDMSTDPSTVSCVPGYVGQWITPEGNAVKAGQPIPKGAIFDRCVPGSAEEIEAAAAQDRLIKEAGEQYRQALADLQAQLRTGIIAPAEFEAERRRVARQIRQELRISLEELRGIFTFPPLDVSEEQAQAAAAGGAAGLLLGGLLVYALTRKK
jgi:hypothetical protein